MRGQGMNQAAAVSDSGAKAMRQSLPGEVDNLLNRLRDVGELDDTIDDLQNRLAQAREHREHVLEECRKLREMIRERFGDETGRLDPVTEPTEVDKVGILDAPPCRASMKGKYCVWAKDHDAHEGTDHQDHEGNIWPAHVLMNKGMPGNGNDYRMSS